MEGFRLKEEGNWFYLVCTSKSSLPKLVNEGQIRRRHESAKNYDGKTQSMEALLQLLLFCHAQVSF